MKNHYRLLVAEDEPRILRNIIVNREGKEKPVTENRKRQASPDVNFRSDQGRRN